MADTHLAEQHHIMFRKLPTDPVYDAIRRELPEKVLFEEQVTNITIPQMANQVTVGQFIELIPTVKKGAKWLSNDLLDYYLDLLKSEYKSVLPVVAAIALSVAHGEWPQRRFSTTIGAEVTDEAFHKRRHLWPVLVNSNHWILITVDWSIKRFSIYDSQNFGNRYEKAARYIRDFYAANIPSFQTSIAESIISVENVAYESNAAKECGVFVAMRSAMIAGSVLPLKYIDYRTKMAFELLTGHLTPGHPPREMVHLIHEKLAAINTSVCALIPRNPKPFSAQDCTKLLEIAESMQEFHFPQIRKMALKIVTIARRAAETFEADTGLHAGEETANQIFKFKRRVSKEKSGRSTPMDTDSHATTSETRTVLDPDWVEERRSPVVRDITVNLDPIDVMDDEEPEDDTRAERLELVRLLDNETAAKYYHKVRSELDDEDWEDEGLQILLRRELRKIVTNKRHQFTTVKPQPTKPTLMKMFRRLQEMGEIPAGEEYSFSKMTSAMKRRLAFETYEDGMSGDERSEFIDGPPLVSEDKENPTPAQCRACDTVCTSTYNTVNHVLFHAVDACFQRRDVFNRTHARVNLRALKNRRMVSALYVQHAPTNWPRNRYKRSEWPELKDEEGEVKPSTDGKKKTKEMDIFYGVDDDVAEYGGDDENEEIEKKEEQEVIEVDDGSMSSSPTPEDNKEGIKEQQQPRAAIKEEEKSRCEKSTATKKYPLRSRQRPPVSQFFRQ